MSVIAQARNTLREIRRTCSPPVLDSLILFATDRCNLRCPFRCNLGRKRGSAGREISPDEAKALGFRLGRLRSLAISGGEPFLRSDFGELLAAFLEGCDVETLTIPTNGTRTGAILRETDRLFERFPDLRLTIAFSIDGPREVHDALRGVPGTFDRAMETLGALSARKARRPSLRIKVGSVLCRQNQGALETFLFALAQARPELDEIGVGVARDPRTGKGDPGLLPIQERIENRLLLLYDGRRDLAHRRDGMLPRILSRMMRFGSQRLMASARGRVSRGGRWPFRCVAGRKGAVVDADGGLRSCELRPPVVNLREFDSPVFNRPEIVGCAVRSALAQGLPRGSFEILVVDDGSSPPLRAIWREPDPAVRIIEKEHSGISDTRNLGIRAARGECVAFLDSDDEWLPGKLSAQISFASEQRSVGLVHTNLCIVDEAGRIVRAAYLPRSRPDAIRPKEAPLADTVRTIFACVTSTTLVRRRVALDVGGFDPQLAVCEDGDFFLRVAERCDVGYLRMIAVRYRRHDGGSHCDTAAMERSFGVLIEKMRRRHGDGNPEVRRAIRLARRLFQTNLALPALRRGRMRDARILFARMLREHPFLPLAYAGWTCAAVPPLGRWAARIVEWERRLRVAWRG